MTVMFFCIRVMNTSLHFFVNLGYFPNFKIHISWKAPFLVKNLDKEPYI